MPLPRGQKAIREEVERERRAKQVQELSKTHAAKSEGVCGKNLPQTKRHEQYLLGKKLPNSLDEQKAESKRGESAQGCLGAKNCANPHLLRTSKKRSEATKVQRAGADKKLSAPMRQIIDTQTDRNNSRSQAKAAELFNTNRTYVK